MPRASKVDDRAYSKKHYAQNKEAIRKARREYYQQHREDILKRAREFYYPRERAQKLHRAAEHRQEQKRFVLMQYSKGELRCACCGISDIDVLSLDHVNGGGTQHRKTHPHSYRWAIKEGFPSGFQVLCFNCNWKKRLTQSREDSSE